MRKLLLAAISIAGLMAATSTVEARPYHSQGHNYHHGYSYGHRPHGNSWGYRHRYRPSVYVGIDDDYDDGFFDFIYAPRRYYRPRYDYDRRYGRHHSSRNARRHSYGHAKPRVGVRVHAGRSGYSRPRVNVQVRPQRHSAYNGHRRVYRGQAHRGRDYASAGRRYGPAPRFRGYGPRPGAWCGWFMRGVMGVRDPSYNLARNWAHWGRPAGGPKVGAVVVWPHHVGKIVGRSGDGRWIVHQGNYNNRVATVPMKLRGTIAYRMPR